MPRFQPKPRKMATYYADPWLGWNNVTYGTSATMNSVVWNNWATGTAATSSNITVWNTWVNANTGPPTGSTISTQVWNQWVTAVQYDLNRQRVYDPQCLPPQPSAEELERRRVAAEDARKKAEERQARLIEAKARAKALLLDHLDPVQKRDYEEKGTFRVEVGSRTFQINPGTHGNVKELHLDAEGREIVVRSFCIPSARHDLPEPDVHLSQKLMLEGGDDCLRDFHRIANITEYRPELRPRFDRELQPA